MRHGSPSPHRFDAPIDIVDDGLTDVEIAARIAEWLDDLREASAVELPVSAADELAAARRDGDL